jgi:hypothetical protein
MLDILNVPASNTIIERLFSAAKNVVSEEKTRLDCEKINQLLFLQENMKTLKQLLTNNFRRKRTVSMSSTTVLSSVESTSTVSKQFRLDVEDSSNDLYDKEIFLD